MERNKANNQRNKTHHLLYMYVFALLYKHRINIWTYVYICIHIYICTHTLTYIVCIHSYVTISEFQFRNSNDWTSVVTKEEKVKQKVNLILPSCYEQHNSPPSQHWILGQENKTKQTK